MAGEEEETAGCEREATMTAMGSDLRGSTSINRLNKSAKLAKQNGVDEEEEDELDERNGKCKPEIGKQKEASSGYNQRANNDTSAGEKSYCHIDTNLNVPAKPKALVRSHAFSGDDDFIASHRQPLTTNVMSSRSNFSSASFDSGHGYNYTDSTGINLLSFITCTLHKNLKDRHMLLQLEDQMKKLVRDPTRNSQKFPAMSSYNRMLVHRVAAFFGLDHNVDQLGTAVVVNKTSHTRLPDIEFSSLIQSDVYTDEPRRYLKRGTQSYEEGRLSLGANIIVGRRARSFEVADCLKVRETANVTVGCTLPINTSFRMHLLHQQGSTSTDASSTHLHESPGSCYSYSDLPFMGVYSTSEGSTPFSSTTHVFPWSSSESYTSSSTDHPLNLISPIMHNHTRTSLLNRGVSIDVSAPSHRSSFSEQRTLAGRRSNSDWHRSEAVSLRGVSIPENPLFGNLPTADEQQHSVEISTSQHQTQTLCASLPAAGYIANQYIVSPVPESGNYAVVSPYLHYGQNLSIQKLPQQMETLCITGYPELVPAQPQSSYFVSTQPVHTIYPSQLLLSSQVGAMYSPQSYIMPIIQRNHVPNAVNVQGAFSVGACLPSYDCNVQPGNVEATTIVKSEPKTFEGSAAVAETDNLSN